MKPGRELDALVAEKVMGCIVNEGQCACPELIHNDAEGYAKLPSYSTDISAAWQVVEKIRKLRPSKEPHAEFALILRSNEWLCGYEQYESWYCSASASTAPHAICLAAIKIQEDQSSKTRG